MTTFALLLDRRVVEIVQIAGSRTTIIDGTDVKTIDTDLIYKSGLTAAQASITRTKQEFIDAQMNHDRRAYKELLGKALVLLIDGRMLTLIRMTTNHVTVLSDKGVYAEQLPSNMVYCIDTDIVFLDRVQSSIEFRTVRDDYLVKEAIAEDLKANPPKRFQFSSERTGEVKVLTQAGLFMHATWLDDEVEQINAMQIGDCLTFCDGDWSVKRVEPE